MFLYIFILFCYVVFSFSWFTMMATAEKYYNEQNDLVYPYSDDYPYDPEYEGKLESFYKRCKGNSDAKPTLEDCKEVCFVHGSFVVCDDIPPYNFNLKKTCKQLLHEEQMLLKCRAKCAYAYKTLYAMANGKCEEGDEPYPCNSHFCEGRVDRGCKNMCQREKFVIHYCEDDDDDSLINQQMKEKCAPLLEKYKDKD